MFEEKNLHQVIERKEYTFILDRACVQFEPDDQDFHRVCNATFDAIDEHRDYDFLRSNRYFGSFAFYLLTRDRIDNLLKFLLENERLEASQVLVNLYYTITRKEARNDLDQLAPQGEIDDDLKQIRV
jgi:small subunit ribosomal protein S22